MAGDRIVYPAHCMHYNVLLILIIESRDFVTTEIVYISLLIGEIIGTDTGCAGCRRVERTVKRGEHTHTRVPQVERAQLRFQNCGTLNNCNTIPGT